MNEPRIINQDDGIPVLGGIEFSVTKAGGEIFQNDVGLIITLLERPEDREGDTLNRPLSFSTGVQCSIPKNMCVSAITTKELLSLGYTAVPGMFYDSNDDLSTIELIKFDSEIEDLSLPHQINLESFERKRIVCGAKRDESKIARRGGPSSSSSQPQNPPKVMKRRGGHYL